MRNIIRITLLLLAVAPLALAQPAAQSGEQARGKQAEASPQPINSYKLDYAIYELENGKRVNSRSYALLLTDGKIGNNGNVRTGSRVPVATGSVGATVNTQIQYIDVGVSIYATLEQRDGRLFLKSTIETTGTAPEESPQAPLAPVIRQVTAHDIAAAVTLAKPMLLASLDDVVSKRRYQVEVTVTRQ